MKATESSSFQTVMDTFSRNGDARGHFLLESKPIIDILASRKSGQKHVHTKRQLSTRLVTVQQAEEVRIREDYAQLLTITNNHQSCLEHISSLFTPPLASLAEVAKTYATNLSLLKVATAPLPIELQQAMGYVIALFNSYQDLDLPSATFSTLAMLVATVQVEVSLTIRMLAKYVGGTSATMSPTVPSQLEALFLRFVAAVRSYIGTDEPYFLTKRQKRILATFKATTGSSEAPAYSATVNSALLVLLERYESTCQSSSTVLERAASSRSDRQRQIEPISSHSNQTRGTSGRQPARHAEKRKTTTFHQKANIFRYPEPPIIESNVTRTQIDPPLKLLDVGGISIFPPGYGPIDLMYKGYRVGIQEMFGLTKAAFGAAMARASYNVSGGEVESIESDTSTPSMTVPSPIDTDLLYTVLSNKCPSLDVSLLAKAQVSWVQNRWINLASCDPSDLQLLCLEQTMASTIEDSLADKQLDTEQIRQSITVWGDKCIDIALKAPLPKTWTPILTQDGLYVRFLDNKTGTIFNINPEVKEIQTRIDTQYKLLEKYIQLHKNSEIMKDHKMVKRSISMKFISLDLCKNTSGLFKELAEEFNSLITRVGNIITQWAPLYNTSDINLTEHHNLDDRMDSGICFNL